MIKKYGWIAAIVAVATGLYFAFGFLTVSFSERTTITSNEDSHSSTIDLPDSDTAFGGLFYDYHRKLNDSLPHYKYKALEDSLQATIAMKDFGYSSGTYIGFIGLCIMENETNNTGSIAKAMVDSLDNTTNKNQVADIKMNYQERMDLEKQKEKLYFLSLKNYMVDGYSKFYIKNGKNNIVYVKWDSAGNKKNSRRGHYESKEIKVKYLEKDNTLLIPLSKSTYKVLSIGMYVLMFVALFVFAYIFIGLPIQVLVNISKGNPFLPQNVRSFKIMAFAICIITLFSLVLPYIIRFVLANVIEPEFQLFSVFNSLAGSLFTLFIAAGLFIIGKAFEKGLHLQKEQELTI